MPWGAPVAVRLHEQAVFVACAAVVLLCFARPVLAAPTATRSEQQGLLVQIMAHPRDYQAVYAYVKVSEQLGDYEAAIGALERLLFYNQDMPRVKYELGTLYFRLQSFSVARRYFREALASPSIDATTRSRIDAYLPEVDKQLQPARTWIFLNGGVRYQSNASATPNGNQVMSGGVLQPLDLSQPHGSDVNSFEMVRFANDFGFGDQRQNTLETRLSGYLTQQRRLSELNVASVSGSIGPRILLEKIGQNSLTIKPYLTGALTSVGGAAPSANAGAGLALSAPLGNDVVVTPFAEWQSAWYGNGSNANATLGNADVINTGLSAAIHFSDAFQVNVKSGYHRGKAGSVYQSYDGYSAEIAFAMRFDPPTRKMPNKWTLGPYARVSSTSFDAPNPGIDPSHARSDTNWEAGVILDAPMTAHFGLNAAVSYARTSSNIPNYTYDNWSAIIGTTAHF